MSDERNALATGLPGMDGTTALWDDIASMSTDELVRRFRFSVGHFDPRVFEMDDAMLDQAWLPEAGVGRWPIRVLLGHLADAEAVYATRIRKCVAEPGSVLSLWDEDAPIHAGLYAPPGEATLNRSAPPIGAFVASMYTTRQWLGEWLGGLAPEAWSLSVLHPERGELTLEAMVQMATWHLEHHAGFLNLKVEKLLGPRPIGEACEPGGCGKHDCACVGHGAEHEAGG